MGEEKRAKGISLELLEVLSGFPLKPMASIRIKVGGREHEASSTGNGPIDAAYKAINSIVKKTVVLEEFLVQAITRGSDDTGKVHVQIKHHDVYYYGFGADTDIVAASVKAYINALNQII
jgi:2-isopropylmalate synthase